MQGAMLGLFAMLIGLFAYVWSYARSRDKSRSLLIAMLFLAAAFVVGRPLLAYIGNTPERVMEQKRQAVASALADHAAFQALRQFDPDAYRVSIHVLATAPAYRELKPGQPAWNQVLRQELSSVFRQQKYFARTTDPEVLSNYARTLLAGIEELSDESGENCHRYLTAAALHGEHLDAPALLSAEQLRDEAKDMAAVIASASATPLVYGGRQELPWESLRAIEMQLRDEFQSDWQPLWESWKLQGSKASFCQMSRRFIKLVLRLPEPARSQTLRAWLHPFG